MLMIFSCILLSSSDSKYKETSCVPRIIFWVTMKSWLARIDRGWRNRVYAPRSRKSRNFIADQRRDWPKWECTVWPIIHMSDRSKIITRERKGAVAEWKVLDRYVIGSIDESDRDGIRCLSFLLTRQTYCERFAGVVRGYFAVAGRYSSRCRRRRHRVCYAASQVWRSAY